MIMYLDYKEIIRGLNELWIDYLVVGELAVNFHGIPRMTYDLRQALPRRIKEFQDKFRRGEI